MIRFCVLLLLAVFYSLPSSGQGLVRFYVYDSATGIPLEDVHAELQGRGQRVASNADGSFRLSTSGGGRRDSLLISRVGYGAKSIDLGDLPTVNGVRAIALQPSIASLEEIRVSTGTGGVYKAISDLDIHLRPITHSQEVLRMVPGLFIGQHAGGGKSEQIFLRGFDLDHGTDIRLTVDGMPVNMVSHAHGQGYADLHFLIPELIDRVAFNKGPYNAEKGNFTTAGYVDFKTKNFLQKNFIKTEAGSFNTFRTVAGVNLLPRQKDQRSQSLFVAGEASYTKGYFKSPQDFNRFNGLVKYHRKLRSGTTVTATATAFSSGWNASGQIPERAVSSGKIGYYGAIDNTEGGATSRYNFSAEAATDLGNGGILHNQVYFSKYDFLLYSNFTFFKEDPVNGDQIRQKERRKILGYNGTYKSALSGRFKSQTIAGLQARYDNVSDLELSRTAAKQTTTAELKKGQVNELNIGAFAAQTFSLSKTMLATLGARADLFSNTYENVLEGNQLSSQSLLISPKISFDYRPGNNIHLYWYNGRGFHSNDSRVVAQQGGRRALPPAFGSDVGGVFKLGGKLVLHATAWYLFLQQEFVYVGDEGIVEAGGRTIRKGFDLSLRYEPMKHLFIDGDISLAKPKALDVSKEESYLPLAPRLTSAGGITYRKEQGLNGSLRYRFMGDRPANEDYSVEANGYFITDATVNYTKPRWEGGISMQNLLNSKWKETQFNTESRLKDEPEPVTEIHFTPGTPFAFRVSFSYFF